MDIAADARLEFPLTEVFAAYRDDLVALLPFLPNVRRIEVKSRSEDGPIVKLVNEWHAGGEIPAAVRAFISESMLSWTDRATWDATSFTCAWDIETHAFTEAVSCKGTNRFVADGDATVLEIRGSLEIDAKKIRGVPSLLAGKVGKTAADLLVSKIQPNLVEVSRGLAKYLAQRAR